MILHNLLRQYRNLSAPVKASFWFVICNVIQKGVQFLVMPIFTRLMSAEAYGRYSVFLSWYQIISIFATLNMWNYVLNNGMIKYENDRKGYLSSLQGLSWIITIGLFLIYLPISGFWRKNTGLTFVEMLVMFIELAFMPSYEYWCQSERFEYKYKAVVVVSLAVTLFIPFVSIPLIIISKNKWMAAIIGRSLTSAVIFMIPAVLIFVKGKKIYEKEYWRFALKFNIPLIPHYLSGIILNHSDRIMISGYCGNDKAGVYSMAYSAATVLRIINSAILASYIPYTYKSIKNGCFEGIRKNSSYLLIIISIMNLGLICVAPEAIKFLGPEEYQGAMYVIPPIAMSVIFMFLFNLFANIEYYFEKTKFVACASVGSAVLNVILNIIFIPKFGYIAAGYTTLVCYIIYSLGHYIFMRIICCKMLDGRKVYDTTAITGITVISIVVSFFIMKFYEQPIVRYIIVFIFLACCLCNYKAIKKLFKKID